MDYEKKYKEALERAKDFMNGEIPYALIIGENIMCWIFPELRENEDERIRRQTLKVLDYYRDEEKSEGRMTTEIDECIAWLEKQGEQKYPTSQPIEGEFPYVNPAETLDVEIENIWGNLSRENRFIATKDGFHEVIVHFYNWIKKQGMQNLDNSAKTCKEEQKPVENNYPKYNKGDILTDGKSTYKVLSWDYTESGIAAYYMESNGCKFSWGCEEADKELKPLEQNPAWSEEDELSCFESALFTAFGDALRSYLLGEVNVKQWAKEHSKELLEAAKEELKEHWSEEDSPYYDDICEILINLLHSETADVNKDAIQKDLDWLISLEERVHLQTKQEWSEEDEKAFGDALWCCKQAASIAKDENDMGNVWYAEKWLKSLKQRYTWKPSDEQMADLWNMVCECRPADQQLLQDIYYGLKTLRRE